MLIYILKRFLISIITIWVVVTITFFLMRLVPGGPFDQDKKLPPQILQNLNRKYGLDKPLLTQYGIYLNNLVHLDLGPSMKNEGRTVNFIIGYSFKSSAKLGAVTILFSLIAGILIGVQAALHQGKWQDGLSMIIATLGVTIPSFVIAAFLIYFFAVKLEWLPAMGFDGPKYYILPVLALGGTSMAFITRLTRSKLMDVIKQDYIRTARAKGLTKNKVIYKHALRNSLIPVITYLGPLIAGLLTGSFVIESMFGIPGLGREFVTTIANRDYSAVMGVTVFFSTFLILCNFVVDILYVIIDPRIKLEG